MFLDLNQNDARAAVKVYATIMGSSHDLVVSESPGLFDDPAQIAEALASGEADVVAMSAQEYLAIPRDLLSPRMIAADMAGSTTEEYVILVRDDSGMAKLADLRGRRLIVYKSLRDSLSPLWLEVRLAQEGLDPATRFFSHVGSTNKPSRTVLPVFFRQEDACLITRRSYAVMGELNPQLTKQLRVLVTSPSYVPDVTCFRASIPPNVLDRMIKTTVAAQYTTAGRQLLTIFQCQGIAEIASDKLDSSRELIAEYARLNAKAQAAAVKPRKAR